MDLEESQEVIRDGAPIEADIVIPRPSKLFPILASVIITGVLLFGAAAAAGVYFYRQKAERAVQSALPVVEKRNPLFAEDLRLPLPFGANAQKSCYTECFTASGENDLCTSICKRRALREFPRRLTIDDDRPVDVAQEILSACEKIAQEQGDPAPMDSWKNSALAVYDYQQQTGAQTEVYEYDQLLSVFGTAEDLERTLRFPAGDPAAPEAEFTAGLRSSLCLRQSIAATQLAVFEAAQAADIISERFYRQLEHALLGELTTVEKELPEKFETTCLHEEQSEGEQQGEPSSQEGRTP